MAVFPYSIGIAELELKNNTPTYESEARSFRRHVSRIPAHRFECRLKTVPLDDNQFREVWAFVSSLEGSFNSFEIILPRYSKSRGVALGSPQSLSIARAGRRTISIKGLEPNTENILMIGDCLRFAGHSKVYQVIEACHSDNQGNGELKLSSGLIKSIQTNESVTFDNVSFTFVLKNNIQVFKANAKTNYVTVELDCKEAI